MTRLTMEQILRENENCDVKSATSLQLSHRALSDVSCLRNFQNLEKLDISYNCLTSLEGLSGCVNLKWLQVFENKLETLKGVESLSKLTVLNAGRNKLEKMDEICVLSNLRALILNDNNISSICKLDQMKHLNTLVLSRNPIREIGNSLKKVTSMIKLSFSHCKLETIGSSLVACVDLKEARFSHNEITALPEDLSKNIRLRTLDIGNNLIEKLPEIKVLSSLNNLRNLNLLGNPIAENEKLMKKVRRLVPNLRIFNSKSTDSSNSSLKVSEKGSVNSTKADSSPPQGSKKRKKGESIKETIGNTTDTERVKKNMNINSSTFFDVSEAKTSNNSSKKGYSTSKNDITADAPVSKDSKKKKKSSSNTEILEKNTDVQKSNSAMKEDFTEKIENKSKRKSAVVELGAMIKEFDDAEIPFKDLIDSGKTIEDLEGEKGGETRRNDKSLDGIVFKNCNKNKYNKNMDSDLRTIFSSRHEIGMGGASTWNV